MLPFSLPCMLPNPLPCYPYLTHTSLIFPMQPSIPSHATLIPSQTSHILPILPLSFPCYPTIPSRTYRLYFGFLRPYLLTAPAFPSNLCNSPPPPPQKPNSWTYNFVEVSGHYLESSQTWGFRIQCLHYKPAVSRRRGVKSIIRSDYE